MGQKASAAGAHAFEVRKCAKMSKCMYLAPGAGRLVPCSDGSLPPKPAAPHDSRVVRVVCISDTHNEHEGLVLPAGDLLLHTGDCLTETGQRGYVTRTKGVIEAVKPQGVAIFQYFAEWFGALDFPFKVLIGGNHDLVVQGLGKERVQDILDSNTVKGKCVYLEHEEACLDGIRIFGSPFAYWGGKNDAFFSRDCDYTDMPSGTNIMMTHIPAILPSEDGGQDEDLQMTAALHRSGALLHVSGHCHWAHGLYLAKAGGTKVPCVVASVCSGSMYGGPWKNSRPELLVSAQGVRGDPLDKKFGGYNCDQPPIVCDLILPAVKLEDSRPQSTAATISIGSESPFADELAGKPAMLFFGPPNDPIFVRETLPRVRELFDVDYVDSTVDGMQAVTERTYVACLAKLGTEGNLSYPIIEALRKSQGSDPFVAIHSYTAAANPEMRDLLVRELNVNLFVTSDNEDQLFRALEEILGTSS